MVITLVLLLLCLVSLLFYPVFDIFMLSYTVIFILLFAFLIQLFWWGWLDDKESDRRRQVFLRRCDELQNQLEKMILRKAIWQMYLDSLYSENNNK
ncbi:hypothetical protein D0T84_02025 [Dysgonomonas sp. 521]|nr:hypothetical protein [Dysgonomonas sp. 521]